MEMSPSRRIINTVSTGAMTGHKRDRTNSQRLCDCMWVSLDPRERSICELATVVGGQGAMVGGASKSWTVRRHWLQANTN